MGGSAPRVRRWCWPGGAAPSSDEVAGALDAGRTLVQETDVGDQAAVGALVDAAVARFGGLDVLVNNAGTATFGPFVTSPEDTWHKTMRTNVDGVFYASRAALPHLLAARRVHRQCVVGVRAGRRLGRRFL